jgi:hypothetical protein
MSRSTRLYAIIAKVNAPAAEAITAAGKWPGGHAPYTIERVGAQERIRVVSADGDIIAGIGATKDAALDMLEQKVGLAAPATV